MRARPRMRRAVKWGGAVACVLLLAAWVAAICTQVAWVDRAGDGIALRAGGMVLWQSHRPVAGEFSGWQSLKSDPQVAFWFLYQDRGAGGWAFFFPLWVPLAAAIMVTADAWLMDKRIRRGEFAHLCPKCGYNRTGLAPGAVCPECNTPAPAPPSA